MKYYEVLVEQPESLVYKRGVNIDNVIKRLKKNGYDPVSYKEIDKDEYYETINYRIDPSCYGIDDTFMTQDEVDRLIKQKWQDDEIPGHRG